MLSMAKVDSNIQISLKVVMAVRGSSRCNTRLSVVTMAVFTLEDEQIVWTDKSSGI